MGIFSKNHVPDPNVKRNTFDLSFQSNLTLDIGTLYPCFVKEVLPGDTFKIDTAFGLRFMPLAFPIQTKLRADVHFFYVRNRNLWKDWSHFITDNSADTSFPILTKAAQVEQHKTGSLGDYLGLPSTYTTSSVSGLKHMFSYKSSVISFSNYAFEDLANNRSASFIYGNATNEFPWSRKANQYVQAEIYLNKAQIDKLNKQREIILRLAADANNTSVDSLVRYQTIILSTQNTSNNPFTAPQITYLNTYQGANLIEYRYRLMPDVELESKDTTLYCLFTQKVKAKDEPFDDIRIDVDSNHFIIDRITLGSGVLFDGPAGDPTFNISALPFRAYESIYNSFYRDQRNNPYVVDGEVKPDQYLPSVEGGQDNYFYQLRKRNWEQDFITSALPSPQMGAAPLVGMSSTGVASYQSEDGTIYKVKMTTADDGETITGAEYTSNIPNDVARSIVNIASSGISINDFRAVNSLQRWLEANMRKGLKYKDQIASHFGVDISYAELDMPEFLGGCSQMVEIRQINQTSEGSDTSPLGSYAGQADCVGSSNNTIQHYCDEHGFIIGIISVVPVPCYSQLMPKHWSKFDTLDYYFPEFGHIGLQPIPYREVCPLQADAFGTSVDKTFGYQRPWYDYLASTDEVHGQFRTTLRDFVFSRYFETLPSLTPEFLTVSLDQLNNPFSVNLGDHILGQVHFKVLAKRPIPRYGIPRLE